MSGELNITAGGAISVDPEEMRVVATRMVGVGRRVDAAAHSARQAYATLSQVPALAAELDLPGIAETARRMSEVAATLEKHAEGTRLMADAFELADLWARQEMLAISRPAHADVLQQRIDELVASDKRLTSVALYVTEGWRRASQEGLLSQWGDIVAGLVWPGLGIGALALLRETNVNAYQRGMLAKGARLQGPVAPVVVEPLSSLPDHPPRSLDDLASRIPKDDGQVVVEKVTHRDKSVSYEVYIDGTRGVALTDEPWDMVSNWGLFMDRRTAASYGAVEAALAAAGAEPGDTVNVTGYSQGGLIATHLAMSGVYETDRVTLIGTPTVPSLDADQTLIHVFHTDDPVGSGLTGGGPVGTTGSQDSIAVSREYATGLEISSLSAHSFDGYRDTMALADASGDPRIDALHEQLDAEAADIVKVERLLFDARRK